MVVVVEETEEVDFVEVVEAGIQGSVVVGVGAVVGEILEEVVVVEAGIQDSVVVEVGAEEILEEVVETSEAEEVAEGILEVEVEVGLGNREGTWPLLSILPSNLI